MLLATLTSLALLAAPALLAPHDRFGLPACSGADREQADRSFFVLCHSSERKVPLWVGYELRPEHLQGDATRPSGFRRDQHLSTTGATDADYRHSGYSRGHMAPAADFVRSADAIRATFLLSNAVPQDQRVNAGVWAQLERSVRRVAAASEAIYVFTGPVFESEPRTIGPGRVAVPDQTWKVVLAIQGQAACMFAATVPNSANQGAPGEFLTTVDEVERRTGLDFFAALPDEIERDLESVTGHLCARPPVDEPSSCWSTQRSCRDRSYDPVHDRRP
jgi:endonuclease G